MISLSLLRTIVLRASDVLAFIVLGLSAYALSQTAVAVGFYFTYSALGLATAIIHLSSVSTMLILGIIRDGAFTSKLAFEISWLSFLWIMWLATGGQTATILGIAIDCGANSFCGATQAIAAFSFLIWIMLFGYVITLISYAVRAAQAGQNVWLTDVKHVRWIDGPSNFEKPNLMSPQPGVTTYPPGGNPGNVGSPIQYQHTGGHPGSAPVTPQPQFYPQQGGTYQV